MSENLVRAVTINRAPEEVYRYWRNFENLPRFMEHLVSVANTGEKTSHWVAKGPAGTKIEWDAEISEEQENKLIAWHSIKNSAVESSGQVTFTAAPGNRGTEVTVSFEYDPPGGKIGALVARLFGEEPKQQVGEDMRRFKQILEAGEIASIEGQPTGTKAKNDKNGKNDKNEGASK